MFHLTKKRAVVAMAIVGSLALSAGAYAYFTSTGTGSGSATVGSSALFNVAVSKNASSTTLYPGAGSWILDYTVKNDSQGPQHLSRVTALVAKTSDTAGADIIDTVSGNPVLGCSASWFTADATPTDPGSVPKELAKDATSLGTVVVTMPAADGPQDACQGKSPKIIVNAS